MINARGLALADVSTLAPVQAGLPGGAIQLGCRWAQGWLFSAAVPAASLASLLANQVDRSSD